MATWQGALPDGYKHLPHPSVTVQFVSSKLSSWYENPSPVFACPAATTPLAWPLVWAGLFSRVFTQQAFLPPHPPPPPSGARPHASGHGLLPPTWWLPRVWGPARPRPSLVRGPESHQTLPDPQICLDTPPRIGHNSYLSRPLPRVLLPWWGGGLPQHHDPMCGAVPQSPP